MLSLEEGKFLVRLARETIKKAFDNEQPKIDDNKLTKNLRENRGVFVTLYKLVDKHEELRGCIGYPYPVLPLYEATMRSAIEAAFNDPRFPPLREKELGEIMIEVSALTKPKMIKAKDLDDLLSKIKLGRDGLIIERGWMKGLLLPQVPIEYKMTKKEFFYEACMKAGFVYDGDFRSIKVYTFQAEIFKEKEPKGEVIKLEF